MVPSSLQIWSKNRGLLHPTVAIPHPLPTFLSRHPHPSTQPPQWNVLTVTCPPFFSPSSALSRFREMLKKAAMSFLTMTICLLLFWCVIIVEMWCGVLPVSHELHPGIDDVHRVLGIVAPESVLQNTDIVHLPSGVDGSPFDSENCCFPFYWEIKQGVI